MLTIFQKVIRVLVLYQIKHLGEAFSLSKYVVFKIVRQKYRQETKKAYPNGQASHRFNYLNQAIHFCITTQHFKRPKRHLAPLLKTSNGYFLHARSWSGRDSNSQV